MNDEIIKLANQGWTVKQIANQIGLSLWLTTKHIKRLVADGSLKHHTERKIPSRVAAQGRAPLVAFIKGRYGLTLGAASDMVVSLTAEELKWLGKTVPEGVTVAEFCAAILKDLHDDEVCDRVEPDRGYPAFTSCRRDQGAPDIPVEAGDGRIAFRSCRGAGTRPPIA